MQFLSFKFLGVHITDKLKWSTHTDSVVKKAQQHLFNLRRLKKFGLAPKTLTTLTDAQLRASCRAVSPPGMATAPSSTQGSPEGGAVCTTHHWGQTTCPPGHLQHPMSHEGQKDHQGQQPPEPLPVHPAIIQKARSVQVHQSGDGKTASISRPSDC